MKTQQRIRKQHPTWEFPDFDEAVFTQKRRKYCICVFVINEGERIRAQLTKMTSLASKMDIVIADGGSTDGSLDETYLKKHKVRALLIKRGKGKLSAQMRMAFAWAMHEGYEGVVVVDGNNKDSIERAPQFVQLLEKGYDHVQGSRFIPGGKAVNTPLSREIGLHLIHAPLISLASGKRHTDTTNGFRAYSARLLTDDGVGVFRDIFQTYELHYHLAIESSRNKDYKTTETPVVRTYPKDEKTPTKISPVKGNAHVMGVLLRAVFGAYHPKRRIPLPANALRASWFRVVWVIAIIGCLLNVAMAYPGYMSLDSIRQLHQATGGQPYTDWHPPVMAFVWGIGITFTGKVSSMLILQSVMLWVAIGLLACWIYSETLSRKISLLPILLGLSPTVLAISGVIWKDSQMAFSLLLAVALGLWLRRTSGARRWVVLGMAIVLIGYAVLLRYNASFAAIPILVFLFMSAGLRMRVVGMYTLITLVLVFAGGAALSAALQVKPSNAIASVFLDDIVNAGNLNELEEHVASEKQTLDLVRIATVNCKQRGVDVHAYHLCLNPSQQLRIREDLYQDIKRMWTYTVTHHPVAYAQYRMSTMVLFMTTPRQYEYIQHSEIIDNPYNMSIRFQPLSKGVTSYVDFFTKDFGFLFRPYFWVLWALILLGYVHKMKQVFAHYWTSVSILVSAIIYTIGYFPVVLAADYRYVYWTVIATLLATSITIVDFYQSKHRTSGVVRSHSR